MFWVVLAFVILSIIVIFYVVYHRFGLENDAIAPKNRSEQSVEESGAEGLVNGGLASIETDERGSAVANEDVVEKTVEEPAPLKEVVVTLPKGVAYYPRFTHTRALEELELSEEEALMFVGELAQQIAAELPGLEKEVAKENTDKVELIVHMLKGPAVSLGKGGISDVLVDFNNYCRNGGDVDVIRNHLDNFKYYFEQLKEDYPG